MLPKYPRHGVGQSLIQEGPARLKAINAQRWCLVGHPDYYRSFGFKTLPGLVLEEVPPQVFFALSSSGSIPQGTVASQDAFRTEG